MGFGELTQLTHFTNKNPFLLLLVHFYFSDLLLRGLGGELGELAFLRPKPAGTTGKNFSPRGGVSCG